MGHLLGTFRAVYLVSLCCIGSFLFAYDTGIVGGVLTLSSFEKDFGYTKKQKTDINSNAVSVLQAGAFFACFFVWPFTARFGRRWSIVLASVIFEIGGVIQVINTHSIGAFYAGRVIGGIGVGMATVLVPMFSAEMAPKNIRGRLGSCFQFFFTLGVMTSYWVDYGVSKHIKPSTMQWQIPIGLQLVPGGILGLGMLLVPESCRWLAKRGKVDEALKSLMWVRGGDDTPELREEFAEILAGIDEEIRAIEGLQWKELLLPANRLRIFIAITLQIGTQLTGNTSLAYYAPQIFQSIGAGNASLLITGFFGLVKVVSCLFFIIFLVERIGRRWSLALGAFGMGTFMLIIAILGDKFPPNLKATHITHASIASIIMVYFEAACYNMSWGPVSWLYMSEIFPSRIREMGIAIGTATQWLFNFVFSQVTPHALDNIGWRTFLMFCIFNWSLVVYVYFFIRETKGKSLEEMENVFGSKETALDLEAIHAKARQGLEPKESTDHVTSGISKTDI